MNKFIVMLFFIFWASPAYSAPLIEFMETEHDFGVIGQGKKPEHVFEFKNSGDEELIIEKVSSS